MIMRAEQLGCHDLNRSIITRLLEAIDLAPTVNVRQPAYPAVYYTYALNCFWVAVVSRIVLRS